MQKALLYALLCPNKMLADLQDKADFTKLLVMQEEIKTLPLGAVWSEYLTRQGVADANWVDTILDYEKNVLVNRA